MQSALDPAGEEARSVLHLILVMAVAGTLIWLAVVCLLLAALHRRRPALSERAAGSLILWGGAAFPAVALIALLAYALWLMPSLRPFAQAEAGGLRIEVTARQYWWRVVYHPPGGAPVVAANEIRLPVGERVEFTLKSDDVIHSFWIPALGGKMDMIPGRTNRMSLSATKPGTFRGPCAEYCGTSHALMALAAVALEPDEFGVWLSREGGTSTGAAGEGAALFLRHGCGACHRVAGTAASGAAGPDLSHLGSRQTLAAGILPNTPENIAAFIAKPQRFKPGVHMPDFAMLPVDDIEAIAAWLKGLQ